MKSNQSNMNKAEQDFKEWYENKYSGMDFPLLPQFISFERYPIEFRWGVYQKFFAENQILIVRGLEEYGVGIANGDFFEVKTPQEAIDIANKLYNEWLLGLKSQPFLKH